MKAETVFRLVSGALQDMAPDVAPRWSWQGADGEIGLVDFLNSAIRATAMQRPELFAVTESVRLEPGMRQKLPVSRKHGKAVTLLEVIRNMGCYGDSPGPAILPANMNLLLAWARGGETSTVIENWAYERLVKPEWYLVYPGVPECQEVWVEATFSVNPRQVCGAEDEIPLAGEYAEALVHHMLAAIMSGDNDDSSYQKSLYHAQMHGSLMGLSGQVKMSWPKAGNNGGTGR